ncbi:hypothetical protein OXPF_42770 [Oxobacter pfennigii]|uniref:Uncharacterized protein n=1 Tax=Oxobacter pfennigii TaxID=36849 RepID=A0A0P9ABP0_9CLOT|nr:hypothetical protein [Oxobacter pfennigii]KPU42492.1 hypothetical protein OXPF_42770 [Oxobacter pfennigii]
MRTKEIYKSQENISNLTIADPYYMSFGKYIYILKYIEDESVLAFDTEAKEFIVIHDNK